MTSSIQVGARVKSTIKFNARPTLSPVKKGTAGVVESISDNGRVVTVRFDGVATSQALFVQFVAEVK